MNPVVHITTTVQRRKEWDHHTSEYLPQVWGVRAHYEGFIEAEDEEAAVELAGRLARVRLVSVPVEGE